MTIEELPDSVRCPDCGTWLPRAALACLKCGRPRDLAVTGLAGRTPPRRVIIGGGAAIAIIVGVVILWAVNRPEAPTSSATPSLASGIAQASHSARPTASPTPTTSPRPTGTAAPSRSPRPTPVPVPQQRGPLFLSTEIPDMGRRATVIASGPRVREHFGAEETGPVLGPGTELLLIDGPIATDGYDWYLAYFQPSIASNQLVPQSGWVPAGLSGQEPTLMEIGPLRCPAVPVTVALLGSMTDLARKECLGEGSFEVHAVLEQCYWDGLQPFVEEPGWLGRFCPYRAYELGTSVSVAIHFPPSVVIPAGLSRGDVVRMVGHVNDPAADDCRLVPGPDGDPAYEASPVDQQQTLLTCRGRFVVSEIEVTGHFDLSNPFGF